MDDSLARLIGSIGGEISATEPARWGLSNRTDFVTLVDGRELVVQRYASRFGAAYRLQVTAAVAPHLRVADIATPVLVRADLDAAEPYAIFERLPGLPSGEVARADLSAPVFTRIAMQMGQLVGHLQAVPLDEVRLTRTWSSPARLVPAATRWLAVVAGSLAPAEAELVGGVVADVDRLFAGRAAVLAHGDFGPTNVLVDDVDVSALLDFEYARLADPLFDVAWWGWLVKFHTPNAFHTGWPVFCVAAGIRPDDAFTGRVAALQVLRVLEVAADAVRRGLPEQALWARRLSQTLGWRR